MGFPGPVAVGRQPRRSHASRGASAVVGGFIAVLVWCAALAPESLIAPCGRIGQYFEKDGSYAQLVVMVVAASAQRTGVGTALLDSVEHWAAENGARKSSSIAGTIEMRPTASTSVEDSGQPDSDFRNPWLIRSIACGRRPPARS